MEQTFPEQERIERQFIAFCRKILHDEAVDCFRVMLRKQAKETNFSSLTAKQQAQLHTEDRYFGHTVFITLGMEVDVVGDLIADALRKLPKEKRDIILLYYFLNLTDGEIAQKLNMIRTTVRYKRNATIKLLKTFLEELQNEEH